MNQPEQTRELEKINFPGISKDESDAGNLSQEQLQGSIAATDSRIGQLLVEQRKRKRVAIVLKVVSVLSGLVIASGFATVTIAQILGGLIFGIAAVEGIFANLSRLLAVTAAKNAYERIRRAVVARHRQEIIKVVRMRDRQPPAAVTALIELNLELLKELDSKRGQIEEGLSRNDYDNLGRLNLEESKQGSGT